MTTTQANQPSAYTPTPSTPSERDTSRDFTRDYTVIQAELRQDSSELQRQVLLWQRWIRYAAVMVAGVAAVVRYGAGDSAGAWVPVAGAAGAYFVFTALMSRMIERRTPESGLPAIIPIVTLLADLLMVSALVYFSAPPSQFHRILILGFLGLQLTVFYFGRPLGIAAAVATVATYIVASRYVPPHVPGPVPTWTVMIINSALFAFVSSVLVMIFGNFRERMNKLRMFVKRVEVGDFMGEYDASKDVRPDDLTLLGQSYNEMRGRLVELVGTDVLTGCVSRRAFDSRLSREWRQARRRGSTLAVLMVDIDHFKEINDTHGHGAGDSVLAELGAIMLKTARETDTVARLGGDEFVIMLPDTAWQGAMTFAERLRRNVDEHHFKLESKEQLPITISVGVALAKGSDPVTHDELVESADRALYKAKSGGRNRICA
ncbi:MAG: GGDEF domain-containing protein [Gemmatimonadaceae bacterium]|nr:GGDEF domain-containing protein [Gemmatimonadaceae bacterium]NUQ92170.1 GGDEF domain-containing protein [Gemmatimonadaceae bacterium]NUR20951.1 GGDEF domain-containing protein [Gemmatimonadaceae bacterium]NUS96766.1 GGDEF domain-containing protein [Gemmatimonadaceae bacterium]